LVDKVTLLSTVTLPTAWISTSPAAPAFRLIVVADAPLSLNSRSPVGRTIIVPPLVEIVAAKFCGPVIVIATGGRELPPLIAMSEAPLAVIDGLAVVALKTRLGVKMSTKPPPDMVRLVASAIVNILLEVDWASSEVVPEAVVARVAVPLMVKLPPVGASIVMLPPGAMAPIFVELPKFTVLDWRIKFALALIKLVLPVRAIIAPTLVLKDTVLPGPPAKTALPPTDRLP
jgi:hypothetical protein